MQPTPPLSLNSDLNSERGLLDCISRFVEVLPMRRVVTFESVCSKQSTLCLSVSLSSQSVRHALRVRHGESVWQQFANKEVAGSRPR